MFVGYGWILPYGYEKIYLGVTHAMPYLRLLDYSSLKNQDWTGLSSPTYYNKQKEKKKQHPQSTPWAVAHEAGGGCISHGCRVIWLVVELRETKKEKKQKMALPSRISSEGATSLSLSHCCRKEKDRIRKPALPSRISSEGGHCIVVA